MNLTAGQETALQCIRDLQANFPEGGGVGVISGYAGTGKTTLIRVIDEECEGGAYVITPTGKASVRVREATGAKSQTIHRWLYQADEDEKTGELKFKKKPIGSVEIPQCGFVIVDEASMVGFDVFRDLYLYAKHNGLNVILIGDGFQLPPVEMEKAKQAFSVFDPEFPAHFKIQLTEVLRQALDSPIIRVSMGIRTGQWAEDALGDLPKVLPSKLHEEAHRVFEADGASICHRNATRHTINAGIRTIRQLPDMQVQIGEPLLVTQNNYSYDVYNGEVITALSDPEMINLTPVAVRDRFKNASTYVNYYKVNVLSPTNGKVPAMIADKEVFGQLGDVGPYAVRRSGMDLVNTIYGEVEFDKDRITKIPRHLHANLGYTLTAHKSQGSEFGEVLVVMEPSVRLGTIEGRRWAYTAVTRGKRLASVCWI
jgi:ATP-dependent exoDNAse (exonuclease V) alpha subunit